MSISCPYLVELSLLLHYVSVELPTTGATVPSSPTTITTTSTTMAPTTNILPLTVRIEGGGGMLSAGQNHVLTCEASGGGSMAYTYMWLKDSSVVSGQTSSTYSFSPLLVVHSGRYSCRMSVSSMTMTSEGVNITVESKSGYDHTSHNFSYLCTSSVRTHSTIRLCDFLNRKKTKTFFIVRGHMMIRKTDYCIVVLN